MTQGMRSHGSCSLFVDALRVTLLLVAGCGDERAALSLHGEPLQSTAETAPMPPPDAPAPPPRVCGRLGPNAKTNDAAPFDPRCVYVPLGFWRFDDCTPSRTELTDTSLERHNVFRALGQRCVPGLDGQALEFASDSDALYISDQPSYAFDLGVTFAAWVKVESSDGENAVLWRGDDPSKSPFALTLHDGQFEVRLRLASDREISLTSPASAGKFTHIAATYDNTTLQLYVDGAQVSQTDGAGKIAPDRGPIILGNYAASRSFRGVVDNLWINNVAAKPTTIQRLSCVRRDPIVKLTPDKGTSAGPDEQVEYAVTIENTDDARCPPSTFIALVGRPPANVRMVPKDQISTWVNAGDSTQLTFRLQRSEGVQPGEYPLAFQVIPTGQDIGIVVPFTASTAPSIGASPAFKPHFVEVSAQYVVGGSP